MRRNATITVTLDNGQQDVWRERDGTVDDYAVEHGAFIVKKDGATIGVYSLVHLVSAIVK